MFVFLFLTLGVLLNTAAAQGTPGDQEKVETMRREMNAMKDELRRVTAGLERVTKENQQRVRKRITRSFFCMSDSSL